MWGACATSEGDAELLQEKLLSILFHIQDKHEWAGHKFTKCAHQKLTKKQIKAKEWISPKPDAFEALQSIILCKNTLKDLAHLTQFCYTGVLEVFRAFYNKWAPKQHFSYVGMLTRSQLAVMDCNEGISLEEAATGQGDKRFNVTISKVTKQWSAKPIKEKKDLGYLLFLSNKLQKMKSLTILLFLNCRKILLESQNLIKLLLLRTKTQDLESEFSFFNYIYFLHLSKSSTKKNDNLYNLVFLPNT